MSDPAEARDPAEPAEQRDPAEPAEARDPAEPGVPVDPAVPVPERDWSRLHPVTPLVKGWAALVVGLFIIGEGLLGGPGGGPDIGVFASLGVQLGGVLVIAVLVVLGNVAGWYMARYRIDREAVQLSTGVLNRTQRRARLDRLQAVDVVQPLIGRLVGLAELRIEVAGGADSQVRLQYLKESEAHRLRNALLAAAAGVDYDTEDAPEAPEAPVLEVPPGRLVGATLLSGPLVVVAVGLLVLAVLAVVAVVSDAVSLAVLGAALVAVVPGTALVLVATVANGFTKSFNFRLATSPDGLRVRAGLTETRSATIPPGRVQALQVSQSILWRRAGWWHVKVNVAGYAMGADMQQTSSVLLPVGDRQDALALLRLVLPGLTAEEVAAVDAGLTGSGTGSGFVHSPRRARWLDPLAWRRNGYLSTERALLARSGLLNRVLTVVPHERAQSMGLRQGPLQRALGVATFTVHSTPGPVSPGVPHLDGDEAARLLREEGERGRVARAAAGPERWMRAAAAPATSPDPATVDSPAPVSDDGAAQPLA